MHECTLCGAEERWIDDGGPPDGWIFVERLAEPVCGACLGSLGFGPRGPAIIRRAAHLRQDPGLMSCDRYDVTSEDEAVYRWLDFEPTVDETGAPCWRWTRSAEDFAALAPYRRALLEGRSRRLFS